MGMRIGEKTFKEAFKVEKQNKFMRGAVSSAQDGLRVKKLKAQEELGNWEEWRQLSAEIRQHTLENLDYYLNQLSENVAKLGGHVYFAETKEEASNYIAEVVKKKNAKKIVKSKSMVTEEINMNHVLQDTGAEVVETDLGEYLLQIDEEDPPSHIVAPALHKNRGQIRRVLHAKEGYEGTDDPTEMARFVRKIMREKFLAAEVGITGCNFAVADSGSFCLVTNEGNARMSTTVPKTQITVMGMERIVPSFKEMEVLVGMLSRSAVGQKLPSYVTTLTGPRGEGEIDGPEEFHLVIVDNGRSTILGTQFQEILQCIRCGACMNVCPVYRHSGGHSYGSIYPGPVGAVLSPLLGGYEEYGQLPYSSSLCAACSEACPVKIPLHDLLLKHRQVEAEELKKSALGERLVMKGFGIGTTKPHLFQYSIKMAGPALKPFANKDGWVEKGPKPLHAWTQSRDFPTPEKERFNHWMKEHLKQKEGNH
ncbi:LutB/LldF family L-lactate oxidation iron-sulfur protein [Staphylococcus simulans]|uniref:LutB/LldF family L-lactate oxidation iron-sulfur protein n=1 Tax=Staphylococcus simulans TaxID=1286 RepID=UPI000D1D1A0E|nr:LutB/LldF family L-lactate oxidation iron-sulfur protein [Staphylococcus simulans]PTJ21714.1 iron-sulfur cluster-binding protein [Staphylococcus simulans]